MNPLRLVLKKRVDVPCTVEIENTFDSLHAHVELPDEIAIQPGDSVIVHGQPIRVPYGESHYENRTATVVHASLIERAWTRMTGDFGFMELCEFSFSAEKEL